MSTTININGTARLHIEADREAGVIRLKLDNPVTSTTLSADQAETVAQVIAALTGRPSPTTDLLDAADTIRRVASEEVAR